MLDKCCVPQCKNVSKKANHRFYLMPRTGECHDSTKKYLKVRRDLWISSTKCIDLRPKDMFVCQLHFVKGNILYL